MRSFIFAILVVGAVVIRGAAQEPASDGQSREQNQNAPAPTMDMPDMNMSAPGPDWMPSRHAASGTAWQPAATPAHLWMKSWGAWDGMAHGTIFADYNQQGGPRGAGKAESVNWLMLMEQHGFAGGSVLLNLSEIPTPTPSLT